MTRLIIFFYYYYYFYYVSCVMFMIWHIQVSNSHVHVIIMFVTTEVDSDWLQMNVVYLKEHVI